MLDKTYRFPTERHQALADYIKQLAQERSNIHHSELKSIAESYRFSYAAGRVLARKYGLKVK